MSGKGPSDLRLKAAVSVSEMARLCSLSRARFYDLVERGVFLYPVYSVTTRRPYYTAEMQQENMAARQTGIGCNGEFVIFYEKQPAAGPAAAGSRPAAAATHRLPGLLDALRSLGLENVTAAQVDEAVRACFPQGTTTVSESEVLRAVNRRLRRPGVA